MQVQDNIARLVMENMSNIYFLQKKSDIFNLYAPGRDKLGTTREKTQPWLPRACPSQHGPGKSDTLRYMAQGHCLGTHSPGSTLPIFLLAWLKL